jgi:hypothetical protein
LLTLRELNTCFLFALLAVLSPSFCKGQEVPSLSFSCAEAKTLDEKTVCSDPRLAELDRLQAAAYQEAKRKDPVQAVKDARKRLEERALCGNDRICLLDSMSYSEGVTPPDWLEAYRKQLVKEVLKDDLTARSYAIVGKRTSFPTGYKVAQATLIQIRGVDTDHASATGKITYADNLEYCERDPGGITIQYGGRLTIAQCARREQARTPRHVLVARANCEAKRVTLWDGTWRFLRYEGSGITWKNPRGQVEEFWSGTVTAEAQFQLLCPNTFARIRADAAGRGGD